ncbi:TlpA disulfide reductase family protein [Algoriphagus sp.]|uniref:peroxiredoxin family protein n=1 Tax=Algoriphagus sp. TaxID=1872435 RepID=UPI002626A750|nr:TlpA disulfide reductase family protein [Algoriphagus sp.]
MKKRLFTCFLAWLCLIGSELKSQVAWSPEADLSIRSELLRGGDSRPDISQLKDYGLVDSDLDSGAGEGEGIPQTAPVTVFIDQMEYDADDHESDSKSLDSSQNHPLAPERAEEAAYPGAANHPGREEYSTPAQKGEENTTLIYGEIINPDSLSPLMLSSTPYYVDPNSQFAVESKTIETLPGEFFDGLLNNGTRKFSVELPLSDRVGYFTLTAGDRTLIDNFLVIPGDSIKINLDLRSYYVSFAGKNAPFYELQYLLAREENRVAFQSPRQLVLGANSSLLQKQENLDKIRFFQNQFGNSLNVISSPKTNLKNQVASLENPENSLASRLDYLRFFEDKLDAELLELIRLDLMAEHYRGVIASIRNFSWEKLPAEFSPEELDSVQVKLRGLLENLPGVESSPSAQLVSRGFLGMEVERLALLGLIKGESLLSGITASHEGEVADRIKAGFLSRYLGQYPKPEAILENYLRTMSFDPWVSRVESLKRSHIPGDSFLDFAMVNAQGDPVNSASFKGKPTLVYVYFSTCRHSADFFNDFLFPLYRETSSMDYELVAISVDEDQDLWKSRLEKYSDQSITNLNISGKEREAFISSYEIFGFPKVFLLDESGVIQSFKIEGWDQDSRKAHVLQHLGLIDNHTKPSKP